MLFLLFSPSPSSSLVSLTRAFSLLPKTHFKMSTHAFAGNPIKQKTPKSTDPFSPNSALKTLKNLLLSQTHFPNPPNFRVLPFRKGRPLAGSSSRDDDPEAPNWHLGWLELGQVRAFLGNKEAGVSGDEMVYLGSGDSEEGDDVAVYWAVDVSDGDELVGDFGSKKMCFVELRTLMVATDWSDDRAMAQLAVAGHKLMNVGGNLLINKRK